LIAADRLPAFGRRGQSGAALHRPLRIGAERALHVDPAGFTTREPRRDDAIRRLAPIGPLDQRGEQVVLRIFARWPRRDAEGAVEGIGAGDRANKKGVRKERPIRDDAARVQQANANRAFTPLRATLNRAFALGKVADDSAWRRVKPYAKVSAPRI
jgi:hypothetical protein